VSEEETSVLSDASCDAFLSTDFSIRKLTITVLSQARAGLIERYGQQVKVQDVQRLKIPSLLLHLDPKFRRHRTILSLLLRWRH